MKRGPGNRRSLFADGVEIKGITCVSASFHLEPMTLAASGEVTYVRSVHQLTITITDPDIDVVEEDGE